MSEIKFQGKREIPIVVICGSSKYTDIAVVAAWMLEKYEFKIAMALRLFPRWYTQEPNHLAETENIAEQMDKLHLRKIDIADEIFVIDFKDYIGESTKREIKHAEKLGKPVRYFSKDYIGELILKKIVEYAPKNK